jgi:hypothetical protein
MAQRSYQASGNSNGALPFLIIAALLAGVAIGALEGWVSKWFSLIVVFQAVAGAVVGGTLTSLVGKRHVRAPLAVGLIAVLGVFASQTAVHYVKYLELRSEVGAELADEGIRQQTGMTGFAGFMVLESQVGTSIKKAGMSGDGLKLTGVGFWILVGCELAIALWIAIAMAAGRAREPYCEACQHWYDRDLTIGRGSGDRNKVNATIRALRSGDPRAVKEAFGEAREGEPTIISLKRCGSCEEHEPQLTLMAPSLNKKKGPTQVYKSMLRADEARALMKELSGA